MCKSISNLYLSASKRVLESKYFIFALFLKGGTRTPPKIPFFLEKIFANSSPWGVSQNSNGANATYCNFNLEEYFFWSLKSSSQILLS